MINIISLLRAACLQHGIWDRVRVVTHSEFGRRVEANTSRGTDHGAAAAHFMWGGCVRAASTAPCPAGRRCSCIVATSSPPPITGAGTSPALDSWVSIRSEPSTPCMRPSTAWRAPPPGSGDPISPCQRPSSLRHPVSRLFRRSSPAPGPAPGALRRRVGRW
ncbi:MAG: DUF1501 domain-containing protein [Armatimonadota bacterium]